MRKEFGQMNTICQGDVERILQILDLQVPHGGAERQDLINTRIRPFMSTPLRLAATGRVLQNSGL